MRIYFVDIRYEGHPILWEHDKEYNKAWCTYRRADNFTELKSEDINELLKNIDGINITNGKAIIADFESFIKTHAHHLVITDKIFTKSNSLLHLLQEKISPRSHTSPRKGTNSPREEKVTAIAPSPNAATTSPPPSAVSSPQNSPKKLLPARNSMFSRPITELVTKFLPLEVLLKDHLGSTLVYEEDLPKNNLACLARSSLVQVHSVKSLEAVVEVIKHIDFYFLRQRQIGLIKNEIYEKLAKAVSLFNMEQPIPVSVLEYLRDAIVVMMSNERYMKIPTGYEHAEALDKIPVPVKANYEMRMAFSKEMVKYLSYLVRDIEVPVENKTITGPDGKVETPNIELIEWLKQFKKHLNAPPKLIQSFIELEKLIVCTGLMDFVHSQIKKDCLFQFGVLDFTLLATRIKALEMDTSSTLAYALEQLREEHRIPKDLMQNLPDKLYSLRYLLTEWCKKLITEKMNLDDSIEQQCVDKLLSKIFPIFISTTKGDKNNPVAKWISYLIKEGDTDLFITMNWKEELSKQFSITFKEKLLEPAHDKTSSKKDSRPTERDNKLIEIIQEKIVRLIENLVAEQLSTLQAEPMKPTLTPTSSIAS